LGTDKNKNNGEAADDQAVVTVRTNMVVTARLIAEAALMRRESRGGHFRVDFPSAKSEWRGRHIVW
jgi:L-aspartate oxidase